MQKDFGEDEDDWSTGNLIVSQKTLLLVLDYEVLNVPAYDNTVLHMRLGSLLIFNYLSIL